MIPHFKEDYRGLDFTFDAETGLVTSTVDIFFYDSEGREWCGPAGRWSDGTSIPRPLWSVFGHPFDKRYILGAYLHDFAYRDQQLGDGTPVTRGQADAMAREAWVASYGRVTRRRAWSLWSGLRAGGWLTWRKYARINDGEAD